MTTTIPHPVMNFYGFARMPFDKDFESADAFPSPSLANAVAMLTFGVESEDILLVSGPIGSGNPLLFGPSLPLSIPTASPRSTSVASAFPLRTSLNQFCSHFLSNRRTITPKPGRCISSQSPNIPTSPSLSLTMLRR